MHPRHRIDLSLRDVGAGLVACLRPRSARSGARDEQALLERWRVPDAGMVCASVRSAWCLLLGATGWPTGTEVVVSAITHPDMVAILDAYGFVAVPVDVEPDTLLPSVAAVDQACTGQTRAVLVAQLFGGRADLGALASLCAERGLLLMEDAAQAYTGPDSVAATRADVSLVSFGLIKTASAVGGAVAVVRAPTLLARMRTTQRSWPVAGRGAYAGRLVRAAGLLALASRPAAYGALVGLVTRLGGDVDALVAAATRTAGVGGADPTARFRQGPTPALLALLRRRVSSPGQVRLGRRRQAGEWTVARLPEELTCPGAAVADRSHWLLPVRAVDPAELVTRLRAAGFDASPSTSNLVAVVVPGRPEPHRAVALMSHVVYLPAYPELPHAERRRLASVLGSSTGSNDGSAAPVGDGFT